MAKSEKSKIATGPIYVVVSPFRDKDNFDKLYKPGEDVSHFDKDRLESLVKSSLVQIKGNDES